jgi:acyl-coenzyme A thioesterase PaaI-like protein
MEGLLKTELPPLSENGMCYGCGVQNPVGLKMKFYWDKANLTTWADFSPGENLQGWAGFVHGGIISLILDEAMGWAAMLAGTNNVTARMQVRFRQMLPIGGSYRVSCKITKQNSRLIETEAVITDNTGKVYADGTSVQFIIGPRTGQASKA